MFGYIKTYEPELKVKEQKIYKSIYCGLCKNLGPVSRLYLSYDCTFLVILFLAVQDEKIAVKSGRCVVNIFKKCNFCTSNKKAFKFSGAVCTIMAYYKILDDINDLSVLNLFKSQEKSKRSYACLFFVSIAIFSKKILLYFILFISKIPFSKASKLYPELANIIENQIQNQKNAEESPKTITNIIDKSAESSANMLSNIFKFLSNDDKEQKVLGRFGYFLGKWVYLIDAVDDLEKDIKNGNFNPFSQASKQANSNNIAKYCEEVLNQVYSQMILAYNLLDLHNFCGILNNIVELGLRNTQKKVLKLSFDKDRI